MFKVLLVLDKTPGNPQDLGLTHPHIQGELLVQHHHLMPGSAPPRNHHYIIK